MSQRRVKNLSNYIYVIFSGEGGREKGGRGGKWG